MGSLRHLEQYVEDAKISRETFEEKKPKKAPVGILREEKKTGLFEIEVNSTLYGFESTWRK